MGIVSLVPGISGGTIILFSKFRDNIYKAISDWKNNKIIILSLLSGVLVGALGFARILEYFFVRNSTEVLSLFSGFILFSCIKLIYSNKKVIKTNYLFFGIVLVLLLSFLVPKFNIVDIPNFSISLIIIMIISGFIDGFITILPGISGSMVLMILGPYYIYKSLLANFSFIFAVPLLFYFMFNILGIYLGAKITTKLFSSYFSHFISIAIGFIIGGLLTVVPLDIFNNADIFLRFVMLIIIAYIFVELTTK